jgi:hypothetical protein
MQPSPPQDLLPLRTFLLDKVGDGKDPVQRLFA